MHEQQQQHFMSAAISPQQLVDAIMRADRGTAVLAHELRDPLSVITICLEEMHGTCAVDAETRLTHQMARDASAHMSRLIVDVLDLCRASLGTAVNRTERVDLGRVVMAAVGNAQVPIRGRGHHLSCALPPGGVLVQANPTRLQQILTNLLVNAAKFTEPGGRISLTAEDVADTLVIRVRDNGIGMTSEALAQVFDPYWQQSPGTAGRGRDGLGIGLSLVRTLVELHGGTVRARSDGPGRGTEFIVRIPDCIVTDARRAAGPCAGLTLAECTDFAG